MTFENEENSVSPDSKDAVLERRSKSKHFREISVSYGSNKSSSPSLTNDDGDSSEKEIKSRSISSKSKLFYKYSLGTGSKEGVGSKILIVMKPR